MDSSRQIEALDLSDSGDIWGSSAKEELMDANFLGDFSVFVDPLEEAGSASGFLPDFDSEHSSSSSSWTATTSSGGAWVPESAVDTYDAAKVKSENKPKSRKRERPALDLVDGKVLLEKNVELRVESLDDFLDYQKRLEERQKLSAEDRKALDAQKIRIRNRLYSQARRQKIKEGDKVKVQLESENHRLRKEVEELRRENESLRGLLERSGIRIPTPNKLTVFALIITFSMFFSPISMFQQKNGQMDFRTGRSLMSARDEQPSQSVWSRIAAPVVGMFTTSYPIPVYIQCGTRSNSTHLERFTLYQSRDSSYFFERSFRYRLYELPMI